MRPMDHSRRVTRSEVARRAGVAPTTVSAVLNGRAESVRISAETCERVLEAARALGYVPNAAARSLRRRGSRTIALMLNTPGEGARAPVFADILLATVDHARRRGHPVLLLPMAADDEADYLMTVKDADFAGVICEPTGPSRSFGEQAWQRGVPVVWLSIADDRPDELPSPVLWIDPAPGVRQLANHIRRTPYRRLAVVPGPGSSYPDSGRYQPLMELPIPVRLCPAPAWTVEGGRTAMNSLAAEADLPDIVFAGNDLIASGVLQACREHHLAVPTDVAVVGFGDFPTVADLQPRLSTLAWPLEELARRAVDRVLELTHSTQPPHGLTPLTTELILRDSTRPGVAARSGTDVMSRSSGVQSRDP